MLLILERNEGFGTKCCFVNLGSEFFGYVRQPGVAWNVRVGAVATNNKPRDTKSLACAKK